MLEIGVIGRTIWDEWSVDSKLLRSNYLDNFGGPGANTAIALSNYGVAVSFATRFGTDKNSKIYKRYLENKLDLIFSITTQRKLPIAHITPFKSFYWENGDNGFFDHSLLDLEGFLFKHKVIFIVEPNLIINQNLLPPYLYIAPQLSIEYYPDIVLYYMKKKWITFFLNNNEKNQIEKLIGDSILNFSKYHQNSKWIITNGPDETQLIIDGNSCYYSVPKAIGDYTVGCGDVFAASCCYADLMGSSIDKSIQFGHKAASFVLMQIGCQLNKTVQVEILKNN